MTIRPRVADVGARVDRRPADVHADRAGRRGQLDEPALRGCQRAASTLRSASSRGSAAITVQSSGPRSRAGQREAQRLQVAADRLQLAHDRARARRAAVRARSSREALERRPRLGGQRRPARARGSRAPSRGPRSGRARRAAPAPARRARRPARPAPRRAARRSRRSRAGGSAAGRGGRRARARRARRGTRGRPRRGCRRRAGRRRVATSLARFESFLPSGPSISPWWTYSGGSKPSARGERLLQLAVRPVVGAAHDVRDPEVVRRRRRSRGGRSALPSARSSVDPTEAQRAVVVLVAHGCAPPRGAARRARSAAPGPRPSRSRASARSATISSTAPAHLARRVGVVDPEQQPVAAAPVRDAPRARRRDAASRSGWARSGCERSSESVYGDRLLAPEAAGRSAARPSRAGSRARSASPSYHGRGVLLRPARAPTRRPSTRLSVRVSRRRRSAASPRLVQPLGVPSGLSLEQPPFLRRTGSARSRPQRGSAVGRGAPRPRRPAPPAAPARGGRAPRPRASRSRAHCPGFPGGRFRVGAGTG